MATATNKPAPKATYPTTGTITRKTIVPRGNQVFLFDKGNYMWMGIGLAFILLGFILMAGGKSADPHQFNYEDVYSFRRITLAPLLILIGFVVEAYAILKKPAVLKNTTEEPVI